MEKAMQRGKTSKKKSEQPGTELCICYSCMTYYAVNFSL